MFRTNCWRVNIFAHLLFFLFVLPAFCQQGWERTYGGPSYDCGFSIQQTLDGCYIVTGHISPPPFTGAYLMKLDSLGEVLWNVNINGPYISEGSDVQQTSDGGYIVVGTSFPGVAGDVFLVRTTAEGDTLWTRNWGELYHHDAGTSVQQTPDGGFIATGKVSLDSLGTEREYLFLVRTDALGNTLWTKAYGGPQYMNAGFCIRQTSNGDYIVAGVQSIIGGSQGQNFWLLKINASGDTLWTKTYGGTSVDEAQSVQQTTDGGYIIAGYTFSFGAGGVDIYLVKTNTSGGIQWTKTFGGSGDEWGMSVRQTMDGGYIVVGYTNSYGAGGLDVWLIKTNASGDTLWTRTYGGSAWDYGDDIDLTSDGGYVLVGYTYSFGNGQDDIYVIKTDGEGSSNVGEKVEARGKETNVRFRAVPNPFISFTVVPGHEAESFVLYNVSGRCAGIYKGNRIGEGLSPGVYFLVYEKKDALPIRIVKVR